MTKLTVLLIFFVIAVSCETLQEYLNSRTSLIDEDLSFRFDSDIVLNAKEVKVDFILNSLRNVETNDLQIYTPEYNFRDVKDYIDENSHLFPLIKKMPKGGIHHIHGFGDSKQIFDIGTYRDDCYMYLTTDVNSATLNGSFQYFANKSPPSNDWYQITNLRAKSQNATLFDQELFQTLQFFTPPFSVSETDMWIYFDHTIERITSLLFYEPVFNQVIMSSIDYFVNEDNVLFVENRGIFGPQYDQFGNTFNETQQLVKMLDLISDFNQNSTKPFLMKFIYSVLRKEPRPLVYQQLVDAVNIRRTWSNEVVGFDLVDEEDRYHTLLYYIEDFLNIETYIKNNNDMPLPYYFHAGETDWSNKHNLYDAVLLNTTRIGHGYAIDKSELLMQIVQNRGISIEICPISNQMLRLLNDLRNHPAIVMMDHGVPITISPDDPIIYGYNGVSYDFYISYMAWNSMGLSSLKQLALNSIKYSSLNPEEKSSVLAMFLNDWDLWLDYVLSQ